MSIRLRLKAGEVELEYEGDETFIKQDLASVLASFANIQPAIPIINGHGQATPQNGKLEPASGTTPGGRFERTAANIYVKLGNKQQEDLVIAAAVYLTVVEGKSEFLRRELLDTMKSATGYYKTNHSKNLSSLLDGLMKSGKLNQLGKDRYSLESDFLEEIKRKLGIA